MPKGQDDEKIQAQTKRNTIKAESDKFQDLPPSDFLNSNEL